jgi:hypothetical protein
MTTSGSGRPAKKNPQTTSTVSMAMQSGCHVLDSERGAGGQGPELATVSGQSSRRPRGIQRTRNTKGQDGRAGADGIDDSDIGSTVEDELTVGPKMEAVQAKNTRPMPTSRPPLPQGRLRFPPTGSAGGPAQFSKRGRSVHGSVPLLRKQTATRVGVVREAVLFRSTSARKFPATILLQIHR